jgi:hypothetical protein
MDILGMAINYAQKYLQVKQESLSSNQKSKRPKQTSGLSDDEAVSVQSPDSLSENEFVEWVKYIDDRFLRAVPFIRSGLKATARAAEFPTLGILAASLETGGR